MKKLLIQIIASLLIGNCAFGQLALTLLSPVSEALKKNAHSVKREESILFDIRAKDKAYYKVHKLITILDAAGKDELRFVEHTDKFYTLEDAEIVLYNGLGAVVKKYSKKDMTSYNLGEGLVSDGKIYILNIPADNFPVHVMLDYEIKFNGLLQYPGYEVQSIYQSVEKSSFTVQVPADLDIRYKQRNVNIVPEIKLDKDKKIYTWSVKDMSALRYEEGSVSYESYYPGIIIAPNKFSLDGYDGEMTSWEKFGEWYGSLAKEATDLSPERKAFFKDLVKFASNDREKAAVIYKYLQKNCRYVLITLGIGGFKPFEASFVDKKKYGDCKALSNYTQACLDAVGIKSYQALINASYNKAPVDPGFSANGFNHVILCVPLAGDTAWLECTSTTNEFGVLGSFTENRNALLITEQGGKLVPTPKSLSKNNTFSTNCLVNLNEDGSGNAKIWLRTHGEYRRPYILSEKKDEQADYLVNQLGFLQPDDFTVEEKEPGALFLEMAIDKIPAFSAGSKMFLSPRIYKLWLTPLPSGEGRTQDFYFHNPFQKSDTTVYKLPQGHVPETIPETKSLSFEYGHFRSSCSYDKGKNELTTIAWVELTNYKIPAAGFSEAKKFFDAVMAEYNSKIVIKKL